MEKWAHLHFDFQLILKNTTEFLDIMLHERIKRLPPERFRELGGAYNDMSSFKLRFQGAGHTDWLTRGLKVIEDTLQGKG